MKQKLKLVGVGASAGGLDAMIDFFKAVPRNCDSAFLVIQHLSPDYRSMMNELLAPHSKLPLVEAVDGMRLDGGFVYLCPPGVIPRVNKLVLKFEMRPKDKSVVLPVDILFESMGRTLGASCAAVVLSGTGSDGAEGILSVEQNGGIVAVQKPETAEFDGMPQSAISTGKCHIIAPSGKLWKEIKNYAANSAPRTPMAETELADGVEDLPAPGKKDYLEIFHFLESRFDLNFSLYRINSVSRRLARRMDLLDISDTKAYLSYLEKNNEEAGNLYHDLLIGVTEFFRDARSFEVLSREAIKSSMLAEGSEDFRIWSAGCATGQEAYSLYILADEVRREVGFTGRITVFATDVFKPSIDIAGKGIYKKDELAGMNADRMTRYFQVLDDERYKIQPHARENIIFAQHDFLSDSPFINMDIVCCRNVLIYLNPDTQEAVLSAFHYSLSEKGFLFLGRSESLSKSDNLFKVISNKAKIFQKKGDVPNSKRWSRKLAQIQKDKQVDESHAPGVAVTINRDLLSAYDSLLGRFAPCGFLINADHEVLHYFGDAADFCVNISGRASSDLVEQLDKPLRVLVTSLMHLAEKKNERVGSKAIRCKARSGECHVDVEIEAYQDLHGEVRNYLIELHRRETQDKVTEPAMVDTESLGDHTEALERIKLLEDELKTTRENLEAANEELQVSNEELQAINEELQVSNEEQQSSNEELNSLNEELTTLNAEYIRKNKELIEVNASHENLLESTEDGVLFVDKDLRIQKFNTSIESAFSIRQGDVGRPLRDIAYQMDDTAPLIDDVRSVLKSGERVERETGLTNGRFYMKRITPYRGEGGGVDGALITFTDVTEIKHLEARFMFALQTAKLSWWDWHLAEDIIDVTSGGSCLLGEDCLAVARNRNGWMEMVHPDDRKEVQRTLDDCLEGRSEEWNCEHRFRVDKGGWLWVQNQGIVTLRDDKGNPIEMMGTTRDVDSYKRALTEAENQQSLLSATDEISKVGVWDYDPVTEELFWSSETRKILEVDEDVAASPEVTFSLMPPADRKLLQEAFKRINIEGTPYDLQLHFKTAKGNDLLCRSAGRARFDDEGNVVRVFGIFQDVTEWTMLQRELKAFFDLSPDFQATLSMDGSFKYWSPSWGKKLGFSEDDLSSMPVSEIVAEADREAFCGMLNQVAAGSSVTSYETRMVPGNACEPGREAKEAWMSWSFSSEPELSLIFVSGRCVTAQKEAQQALQEARLRAENANRAKTDFLAVMSHELRTPLNPILGFSEMLLEEAETEEHKDILKTIIESGDHMLALVDEILEYSKLDAGKAKVEPVEFSLDELVQHKVQLMSGQIKGAPINLSSSIDWGSVDESRSPILVGDVGMIRQVCRNLIANAIKFTREGRVDFDVSVLEVNGDQAMVRFEVKDSGIGIAEADLPKLFTPFTQVQSGTTREFGGTGLGLAICKRLVNLMDGTISAESTEGEGSTFSFTLPLTILHEGRRDASAELRNDSQAASKKPELDGSVLLVEDNESNAFYIKTLLEMRGAEVVLAPNGESALDELRAHAFDLVLLDLHMPGIGGLETLKRMRSSESRDTPVLILTADASAKARENCEKYGVDGFLVKPASPPNIFEVLEKYLKEV